MKYIYAFLAFLFGLLTFIVFTDLLVVPFALEENTEVPIVLWGTIEYYEANAEIFGSSIGPALWLIVFFVLFTFFLSLYHRRKRKKRDILSIDNIEDPVVLYLRSFAADRRTSRNVSVLTDYRSEEEVLVDILSEIAPVYAIGDPKDKKMPLGATRIYVDDEHWKSTVKAMAERAVLVVLRLGRTDSFWWEVDMALRQIPVERLMFVVPESKDFNNVGILYKMLIEHGIDVKNLNFAIEKKRTGSISSFLFFNKEGMPQTAEIRIPRFSKWVLSYEGVLRNALANFRARYGLSIKKQRRIKKYSILQAIILVWLIILCTMTWLIRYYELKYQMPYEIVEKCTRDNVFVDKYSNEINGNNLAYCMVESAKGSFALDEEKYLTKYLIEARAKKAMTRGEYNQLFENPQNMLLMIKKYCIDSYDMYVELVEEAVLKSVHYPEETMSLIGLYKESINDIPSELIDELGKLYDEDDLYMTNMHIIDFVVEHLDDDGIADVIKIFVSQEINI